MAYIDARESAAWLYGGDTAGIIRLLAARYMGEHPQAPYVWRSFDERGIQCDGQARYHFDFARRFPEGEPGEVCWAAGDLYCPRSKSSAFIIQPMGPVRAYLNGEEIFRSTGAEERDGRPCRVRVELKEGYNRFALRCERTLPGFGCTLMNAMPQWEPCCYVMPFAERGGEAGFLYTRPSRADMDPAALWEETERATGVDWLPEADAEPLAGEGLYAAWGCFDLPEPRTVSWPGDAGVTLRVDGRRAGSDPLPAGRHELLLHGSLDALRRFAGAAPVALRPPVSVRGRCTPLLFLGPLEQAVTEPRLGQLTAGQQTWRPGYRDMALRPYVETALFARWTYPLGVTLYGMLEAGRLLGAPDMTDYVLRHVRQVTDIDAYACYDTARYGFAGVNQQLCWLDALDDCGSFGSLMLETGLYEQDENVRRIAARIADYMLLEQPRRADGAFMRRDDTMWVDDLYMSVPFLCRAAGLLNRPEALEECVRQMRRFRALLFMPEKGLMAHMRCLRREMSNGIPWSRGNGWVIFSLSELLRALPERHPERPFLLSFFAELTEGYLRVQDETGMWRQVLDDPEAYLEASSTAMMICAFSRGARHGWYAPELALRAESAARRAWCSLTEEAIDRHGNLYGVCQGSGCSFSRAYYRTLAWNFNDTHGIGIVMLAGVELMRLDQR